MFIARNKSDYVNAEPRGITNNPSSVAKFATVDSFRSWMRDNLPSIKGKFDLISLENGKVTETVTL